ncbi:MAG: dihydrolipoyllysine-residue acetyltransferase [Pseudomonadales bacterium]
MTEEVRIPDIGDVDHVEVIEICVSVGDTVGPDDALIVIESDKASMEVPAGKSGKIASIDVALGDEVKEGTLIVTLETAAKAGGDGDKPAGGKQAADTAGARKAEAKTEPQPEPEPEPEPAAEVPEPSIEETGGSGGETVEVRVPDIGEATNVEVIEVAVSEGDHVGADDLLVVVESDKASMEIPAGQAGTVTGVHVSVGTEVVEGTLLATITLDAKAPVKPAKAKSAKAERGADAAKPAPKAPAEEVRTAAEPRPAEAAAAGREAAPEESPGDADREARKVYAGPAVRRLARELGIELAKVKGSGNRGRILKEDVKAHVKTAMTSRPTAAGASGTGGIPSLPAVDFSRFGPVETQPLSRIRIAGAANLHRSWLNLPHVTQFEEADVTELEEFRGTLKAEAEERGVKITPLAFIIKACCYALQAFPTFNASLDPEIRNFVLKKYYHIGFAVDTPDGLVVPVIRDANRMGVWDLSRAIIELSDKARNQKLGMGDTQGGSFSISSLGNIGGTGFTPIINAPEVAILGVSRLVTKPVWNGKAFEPRQMLPLSLSYDHRAINGAEAGRFMAMLAELLADIRRLSL